MINEYENLYKQGKFKDIVHKIYHEHPIHLSESQFPVYKNAEEMCLIKMVLNYGIVAAYKLRAFIDCLKICELYFSIFDFDFFRTDKNCTCYVERYLHSLLYFCANNNYDNNQAKKVVNKLASVPSEFSKKLLEIFQYLFDGNKIYTSYSFTLPYMLPIADGAYPASKIENVEFIEVFAKEYPDLSSIHGTRWFSKINLVSKGMVANNIDWMGDSIFINECVNQDFILKTINEFITYLRSETSSQYLSRISYKQIGTIKISTQNNKRDDLFFTLNFEFGGNALVDAINKEGILINKDENLKIYNKLESGFKFEVAEKLLTQAKFCLDDELFTEAFYLINSSLEAFVCTFTKMNSNDYVAEYEEFIKGQSICNENEHSKEKSAHSTKIAPSIYKYPRFLKNHGIISKTEEKKLMRLISAVKSDQDRNNLTHGVISDVKKQTVLKSFNAIICVQDFLYSK